jgi:hypothetical protein
MLIGRPAGVANQKRVEFWLPEQVPRDSVPSGISSGSEKRATEFCPWVPKDDKPCETDTGSVSTMHHKFLFLFTILDVSSIIAKVRLSKIREVLGLEGCQSNKVHCNWPSM